MGTGPGAGTGAQSMRLDEFEAKLQACLCLVDVDIPLVALTDGVHSRSFAGNGLVVFQVRGGTAGGRSSFLVPSSPPYLLID